VLTVADVVVDVSNSPSFDDDPVMEFFTTSTNNLVAAAKSAGAGHYVAVSIVGCDELPESGYLRAKVAKEKLIEAAGIPYSIIHATQFAEFTDAITASLTVGDEVRVPDALIEPIATQDSPTRSRGSQQVNHWPVSRTSAGRRRSRSSKWLARCWPGKAKPRPSSSTLMLLTSGRHYRRVAWLPRRREPAAPTSARCLAFESLDHGRGGGIRTHGLFVPNEARYQAAPHPA
jgi:NmrA-like family